MYGYLRIGGLFFKIKKLNKLLSIIFITALTINVVGCNSIKRSDKAIKNTVLAEVDKSKITRGDLDKYMYYTLNSYKEQYGSDYENDDNVKDKLKKERDKALIEWYKKERERKWNKIIK